VAGRVVDASSLEPLAGAQVVIAGTDRGTLVGPDGRFTLGGLQAGQVTLQVSLVGYRSVERSVRVGTTDLTIRLQQEAVALEELVVTGTPGATRERELGNVIARLDATEVTETSSPADVQDLLGSRISGLRIRDTSGEVGTGGSTQIRGVSSLSLSSEPLVYIDGVRVDNDPLGTGAAFTGCGQGCGPSRINDLDPESIASIEVIKGPAAATLYGTEATNGVIQIITKKGEAGAASVRVHLKEGMTYLPSPAEVYQTNWGRDPVSGDLISQNLVQSEIAGGYGSPFSTGWDQGYGASVSGGSDQVRIYAAGDYNRDEGIVSYNWENRLNGRANLTYSPSSSFQARLGIGIVNSRVSTASAAQPLTTHMIWGLPVLANGPSRGFIANTPEQFANDVDGKEDTDRSTISLTLEHDPTGWLSQRLTLGTDMTNVRSKRVCRRDPSGGANPCFNIVGSVQVDRRRSTFQSLDYVLSGTADRLPGELTSKTSVGVQYYRKQFQSETAEGENLAVPSLETVSATPGDSRSASEEFVENRTLGMYAQERIGWRDKMFLTLGLRGDDNSAFGTQFDFVTYPKVSLSWILSDESFFDVGFVNTLKLRAAWGRAGQQPNAFDAIRTYRATSGPGGVPALTPENLGNPDLKPEVGQELEAGFDASVLDGRLALQFTYYDQTTKDAIVERPALPSEGFPGNQFVNVGKLASRGFEVGVNADVLRKDDVSWSLGVAASRNSSEVQDLGDVGSVILPYGFNDQRDIVGFPIGALFEPRVLSAEFDGSGNLVNAMCEGGAPLSRGTGQPVPCADANPIYRGHPLPTWEGSVNTSLRLFGRLELYALASFQSGATRVDGDVSASHLFFRNSKCINTACDPKLAAMDQLVQSGRTSYAIAGILDAGFAKLRTLSASYTLPERYAGLVGADRARVTVSARNLVTLWVAQDGTFGRKVTDPEIADSQPLSMFTQESWPHDTSLDLGIRLAY